MKKSQASRSALEKEIAEMLSTQKPVEKSKKTRLISKSAIKKELKQKEIRSTYSAKKELEYSLNHYSEHLMRIAKVVAKNNKRKQITDEDVREARSMLLFPGKPK